MLKSEVFAEKIQEVEGALEMYEQMEEDNTLAILQQQQLEIRKKIKDGNILLEYLKGAKAKAQAEEAGEGND